jgi:hypothetical protein
MRQTYGRAAQSSAVDVAEMPFRDVRVCEWPGCAERGSFRAPQARSRLTQYFWFCLDHVRDYNAAWNYYEGMTEDQVEADIRFDTVWQRPSWPFVRVLHRYSFAQSPLFGDSQGAGDAPRSRRRTAVATAEQRALIVLDLTPPVTLSVVKARYKELVKRYHPDANGGAKAAEERFKEINEAYRTVMNALKT